MTRADYRALLVIQGQIWCTWTLAWDYERLPYWALNALHDHSRQ